MKKVLISMLTVIVFAGFLITACSDDSTTGPVTYDSFNIKNVMSLSTGVDANPEIVRIVPGSNSQAVFVSSAINKLTVIDYTSTSFAFGATYALDPGSATAEMTSIDVSIPIDGENYVAVCVAEADCSPGWILLVKLSTGEIVKTVTGIGYNPDGCAFTKDGLYLSVACEDDREDRPCKPADRHGGSVSIIDLTNGIANATLMQDYKVDWDVDSEPEHTETSSSGITIVSVQETSEMMIYDIGDVPLATDHSEITVVTLPTDAGGIEAEPDGLYISPDGTLALISAERNGTLQMMDLPSGNLHGDPYIIEDDLPDGWQRDARKSTKRTEPEECSLIVRDGKLYAVLALQESHAVVVYDVTDPANPIFDSMAPAGVDWEADNGMEKSEIGSEGLGAHPTNGVVFSANEREGSITMFVANWAN